MSLTVEDLEKLQEQAPNYRMELVDEKITVLGPFFCPGAAAAEKSSELCRTSA